MFYLPAISQKNKTAYLNRVKDRINDAKKVATIPLALQYISDNLDEILCDPAEKLMRHHHAILPLLDAALTPQEYERYYAAKIKNQTRTADENDLVARYLPLNNEIAAVFNYDKFVSEHKITSYALAQLLDRNTCTYCNRLYTVTVVYKHDQTGRINDSTRVVRPAFDHWFPKSKYPILAMSLHNLIPSCPLCNSSIKGDSDFSLAKYLHPYTNNAKQNFTFDYQYESVDSNNVIIRVQDKSKTANTLRAFKIKEVYDVHSAFELKDMLELRYKYSTNYLQTLFRTFDLSVSEKAAYRMIFGVEYDDLLHHQRPFSKFKKDILEKLGIKDLK